MGPWHKYIPRPHFSFYKMTPRAECRFKYYSTRTKTYAKQPDVLLLVQTSQTLQHMRWLAFISPYWVPIPSPREACTPVGQRAIPTDFSEHLEQVWQSSLFLLQDVLHLGLLLLLLCWRVNGEALQVPQVADDLTWKHTNTALTCINVGKPKLQANTLQQLRSEWSYSKHKTWWHFYDKILSSSFHFLH